MTQHAETVIIGGGQAGLATCYHLSQLARESIVLEQAAQPANAWRNDRWNSFTLVTPNWGFLLPGAEYDGAAPDGYMPRDEIVARFEQYAAHYRLPIRYETQVTAVDPSPTGQGYRVTTDDSTWEATNVVVATGLFQRPRIPALSDNLSPRLTQLAAGQYRNPESLPPGAILVVGSGQSGCQIAEELYQNGRRVFLCVGRAGRAPRRYRGQDIFHWLQQIGFLNRTVDQLESPQRKFDANPQATGARGGHTIDLHRFARDGVVLLGRLQAGSDGVIHLADDLHDSLARVDRVELELTQRIDQYIARTGIAAPPELLPQLRDGYDADIIRELDLHIQGVTTIIWATGYRFEFGLVHLPVLDDDGYPITRRGVTDYPGLYFVGLPWLHTQTSGLLMGVGQDAAHIAASIAGRQPTAS